jgi:hypothetical protein
LVVATCRSACTLARPMRSSTLVQLSGRNNRRPIITGTSRDASFTDTIV